MLTHPSWRKLTQQDLDDVCSALKAIPEDSLRTLEDLPNALPVAFVHEVQQRLKTDGDDLMNVDLRIELLLHISRASAA